MPDEVGRLAHILNRAEARVSVLTGFPSSAPGPSALYDPGLIDTLIFYTALRSEWVRNRLA